MAVDEQKIIEAKAPTREDLENMDKKEIYRIAWESDIETTLPRSEMTNLILRFQEDIGEFYYLEEELMLMERSDLLRAAREREIAVLKPKTTLIEEILEKYK